MRTREPDRLRVAAAALAMALASAAVASGGELLQSEQYETARFLFEQCVLAKDAESYERLEALAHVARMVSQPDVAQEILPLYLKAARSPRVTDEDVAMAVAEGLAACLLKQRQPYVEVRNVLRNEARGRKETAAGAALLAVAERLDRLCEGRATAGRSIPVKRIGVPHAVRVKSPRARAVSVPARAAIAARRPGLVEGPRHAEVGTPKASEIRPRRISVKGAVASTVRTRGVVHPAVEALPMPGPAKRPVRSPVGLGTAGRETEPLVRDAIGAAATSELAKMVEALGKQADWKVRQGDHEGALGLLGMVIRDAPDTPFSAEAAQRALPIALARLAGKDRELMLQGFEDWVGRLGGARDRAHASLLVLQRRYRDGQFARAREGLTRFLASHKDSEFAPRAQLLLALTTWRVGDREKAIEVLRDIVRSLPSHPVAPRAQFLMGYLFFVAGEQEPSHAAFLRVISDYPGSPFAQKAIDFLGSGAANRAEAEAEKLPAWRLPSSSCLRTKQPIRIDGRLDDPAWKGAPILRLWHKGKGDEQAPQPDPNAAFRLLWDDSTLYVAFECRDDDIRSEARKRDDPALLWDAARVLIAPAADRAQKQPGRYFDFALSPAGALSDGKVAFERGPVLWQHVRNAATWNCVGIQHAASLDGTLNDGKPDRGWTAEFAVPFEALDHRPSEGTVWRMNFLWGNKQPGLDRVVTTWSPIGAWLPQPRLFGHVRFRTTQRR